MALTKAAMLSPRMRITEPAAPPVLQFAFRRAVAVRLRWILPLLLFTIALGGCAAGQRHAPGESIHRNLTYAVRGGRSQRLDLYVPAAPRPAPIVVWIHGGGWIAGDKAYRVLVRDLTRDGFAVASVQYRLSYVAPYPAGVDDCADALAWLRANGARYGVDATRLALAGDSSGGHFAALLGTRLGQPRVRAVLALYAPTDLVALNDAHGGGRKQNLIARFLGGPVPDRLREAREANPANDIRANTPPFLFFHGSDDSLVPVEQSELLHRALRRRGIPSEVVVLRGAGHAFGLHGENWRRAVRFFRENLDVDTIIRGQTGPAGRRAGDRGASGTSGPRAESGDR